MFTGIIQAVGQIEHIVPGNSGLTLEILTGDLSLAGLKVGDSIAVNGVCLTVVDWIDGGFRADVSAETLRVTCGLDRPGVVNLEPALRFGDALGGHLVAGHVDGVAVIEAVEMVGESRQIFIRLPPGLMRYVAVKGSVTLDGVSLTVNSLTANSFMVNLIPHTLQATTLRQKGAGDRLNIEVDLMARYIDRLLPRQDEEAE